MCLRGALHFAHAEGSTCLARAKGITCFARAKGWTLSMLVSEENTSICACRRGAIGSSYCARDKGSTRLSRTEGVHSLRSY